MKTTVRTTRAYLAGFGTSGSLLAGAAVLFVLASAIVAFRGWPQISTGPATISVAASHPVAPSRVAIRLAAVLRGTVASGGAALTPAVRRRSARSHGSPTGAGAPAVVVPSGGLPASPSGSSASALTAGGPNSTLCRSGCIPSGSPGPISQLTNTVSQEVSSIGSAVGSSVSSGTSTAGGAVNGVSPQAGSALQTSGRTAGDTIVGTSTTAASTLSQAGSALSGGH